MNRLKIALLSLPLVAFGSAALAGDPAAGEAKADACLECHEPDYFAGEDAAAIEALIREVRAGEIEHKEDAPRDLAEEDIADVAAYFAHEGAK
jgi:cytochrome c553